MHPVPPPRHRLPSLLLPSLLLSLVACGGGDTPGVTFQELAQESLPTLDGTREAPGLLAEVEVIRDRWGVPHIYASSQEDLFFAQGWVQAQDRLWQMEMWRRMGEGRTAEIVGPEGLPHDRLARLIRYRGPMDAREWTPYHPDAEAIFTAFVNGVNAYIEHAGDELPVEFRLTGIRPEPWTVDLPVLRVGTANPLSGARSELLLAQQVASLGAEEANRRAQPDPWRELVVPEGLDVSIIDDAVADALQGLSNQLPRPPLLPEFRGLERAVASLDLGANETSPGSNNWVVSGRLTETGGAIVANDPHRQVANPSLRLLVHLEAPGWSMIGATEPPFPGISMGHNGRVAFGLTVVGIDQADVFVEELNPTNRDEVRWMGGWEPLRVVVDTIPVLGRDPEIFEMRFSRHGPIFHVDTLNNVGYALRSALHEPGSGGYFNALRLSQVDDCREFLEELRYYYAPSENMICGDVHGNIAWRASGLAPRRVGGWDGRLPVPGTGRYRWDGYREDLPFELNPARGWIATANHNILPEGYDPPLFFKRAPYPRQDRLEQVLSGGGPFSMEEMRRLQLDAFSIPGSRDRAHFQGWTAADPQVEWARERIAAWDAVFHRESAAAALYSIWRRRAGSAVDDPSTPMADQHRLAEGALAEAVDSLRATQGNDPAQWRWGRIHRSEFPHPLVAAYDLEPVERSGGGGTVAATGATFREVIDLTDLDNSWVTMTPGQSARPGSPFYNNLRPLWGREEFFPLVYSREAVEANAVHRLVLRPGGG